MGRKKTRYYYLKEYFVVKNAIIKLVRDLNAAKNLEKLGQAMAEVTPVDESEPTPLDEAGSKIDSSRVIISLKT